MRRTLIAVLLALSAQALFAQGARAAPAAVAGSGPAGSLAVMPYYAPPGALPPDFAFSLFTVVDVIRLTLLEEGRFALISLRAGRALPDMEPERVLIETERIVQAARPERSIEGGASLAFPLWRVEQYLAQSPGLRLGFYSEARPASRLDLGARAELYLLNQRQAFLAESGQRIEVLLIPVYAEGRWAALRSRLVALELSIAAGPAVVFGLVSPELISYFRPSAAIGADAVLFPGSPLSLVVGCGASWTFDAYEDLQLTSFPPRLALRFTR